MVLEQTLESLLDNKEFKPVTPKGNQPWIFIGRTDAEAPILWPPDVKSWLIRKDSETGKDWSQKEKRTAEDEMARLIYWLNECEFEQTLGDGEGQERLVSCSPWGHKDLVIEQQQTHKEILLKSMFGRNPRVLIRKKVMVKRGLYL